jgi:hypothetical protein
MSAARRTVPGVSSYFKGNRFLRRVEQLLSDYTARIARDSRAVPPPADKAMR